MNVLLHTKKQEEALRQGFLAAKSGLSRTDNPNIRPDLRAWWNVGWDDGFMLIYETSPKKKQRVLIKKFFEQKRKYMKIKLRARNCK